MNLIFCELRASSLIQQFTVGSTPLDVYAVRPHLVKYLNPAGSLYLQIQDALGNVLFTSSTVTIAAIHAAGGSANYSHGDVQFLISAQLQKSTTYQLALCSSGYTYSDPAFIGWCQDFDLRKISPSSAIGNSGGSASPYLFDLFLNSYLVKGA